MNKVVRLFALVSIFAIGAPMFADFGSDAQNAVLNVANWSGQSVTVKITQQNLDRQGNVTKTESWNQFFTPGLYLIYNAPIITIELPEGFSIWGSTANAVNYGRRLTLNINDSSQGSGFNKHGSRIMPPWYVNIKKD